MTRRWAYAPLLALGLACAPREPAFVYDVAPGAVLDGLATVAPDPRQQVWKLSGQYSADPWEFREPVLQELRAKGFRFVPAGAAELWLDLIAFRPERSAPPPVETGAGGEGRGRRGGGQGGHRNAEAPPGTPSGDVTLIVRLVSSKDEKVLWYGSVVMPPGKPGPKAAQPEELIHRLLEPLAVRAGMTGKTDAKVVN